jgi:hypothetical protein
MGTMGTMGIMGSMGFVAFEIGPRDPTDAIGPFFRYAEIPREPLRTPEPQFLALPEHRMRRPK